MCVWHRLIIEKILLMDPQMGLAWGWQGVGMGLAWACCGAGMELAWGWYGVGAGLSAKSLIFFLGCIRKFLGNCLMDPGSDTPGCIRKFPGNFLMRPTLRR